MQNGVIREVSGMRYVPTGSRNDVCLSRLDRHACTYKTQDGVLIAIKGGHIIGRSIK